MSKCKGKDAASSRGEQLSITGQGIASSRGKQGWGEWLGIAGWDLPSSGVWGMAGYKGLGIMCSARARKWLGCHQLEGWGAGECSRQGRGSGVRAGRTGNPDAWVLTHPVSSLRSRKVWMTRGSLYLMVYR